MTFIDTPGHTAFTEMRARGAQATDIVILVVAADDGVMPQTVESINHAKAAKVPIVVAVNKCDKPGVKPENIRTKLMEYGLVPEEFGGETLMVNVSALKGTGIDDLLDAVLLVAELEDIKGDPDRNAEGIVLEAKLETGRGAVATLLVKTGTLKQGDPLVLGSTFGKIRAMLIPRTILDDDKALVPLYQHRGHHAAAKLSDGAPGDHRQHRAGLDGSGPAGQGAWQEVCRSSA